MQLSFCKYILGDISTTTTSRWCLQHPCIVKEIIQNSHLVISFFASLMLREGDPTFIEELLNYSQRRHIFKILKLKLQRRYKSSCLVLLCLG
ncbi:hypothetical protein BRARA_F02139 [Brassica rapa]|uniref:Uncharacterized protein n=1 Tax=Brassica campestris TaxID=3711 RepID=A0A397YZL6_BRACM|nr:hypothetical protein BRARA_F02139 [Brassica rapa]